jgi:translation initiation factor IF-2
MNKDENKQNFAPVVSVLGHVDHGKTSLLDKIRESSVAAREKGGITQKIGASEIEVTHEDKKRKITFIDTPGHEAFANMRSQGVSAADVVLLVIAADDGIMPQTRESILKILEAKIPYIVVFTKIDLEAASIDRVKQQVLKEGIMLEGLGGDVPYIGVSSKTGEKIKDLLDLIVLVYDLSGIKKDKDSEFMAVLIDAKRDKRGTVASFVIKSGVLSIGKIIYAHGRESGKVKAIINASGKNVKDCAPGDAVEILGLNEILPSGTVVYDREVEPALLPEKEIVKQAPVDIMQFLTVDNSNFIPIILKTETSAELEAIKNALPSNIKVIFEGQGEISVSDVLMAKDFRALILGFNVEATRDAKFLADSEKIFYKSYGIIYQMLDEMNNLLSAVAAQGQEKELGKATILASFLGSSGPILGLKVTEGRLAVGDRIKIFRAEREMGASVIASIKQGKADTKLVSKGNECGIMILPEVDFAPQDAIIAYSKR